MGSSRFVTKDKQRVESTPLSSFFEKMCPIYMSYGMTYDEFWYKSPYRAKFYLDSHKLKMKQQDEYMWIQGMYIYEALCKVSPILHAFSKKGTKPLPYSNKPYLSDSLATKTEKDKEQEKKNAQLIAQLHFKQWAKLMKERFEKQKKGGA